MVCYSENTKHNCARVTIGVSVLIWLLGLATIIFGAMALGLVATPDPELLKDFAIDQQGTGVALIILGAIVVTIATLGCIAGKKRGNIITAVFVVAAFVLGLVLLIVGSLAAFSDMAWEAMGESACLIDQTYDMYKSAVDTKMCTDKCKCPGEYKALWEQSKDTDTFKTALNKAGRDWNSLKWGNSNDLTVSTWTQCYDAFLVNEYGPDSTERKFLKYGGKTFLEDLEVKYDCAGLCYVPLFYMTREIADGPPTRGCIKAAAMEFPKTYGNAGMAALITGIVLLIGVGTACPLCVGNEEKNVGTD